MTDSPETQTWFGDTPVAAPEKARRVRSVFETVAGRYDLANDAMSLGIHRLWKRVMIDALKARPSHHMLDVAGGTGDIAFRLLDRIGGVEQLERSAGSITVCDLTPTMLEKGRDRAIDRGFLKGIGWIAGNAEALPIQDQGIDRYSIAFGLRNVTDPLQALNEAYRVLKPGGRFVCLEFSHVTVPALAPLYELYLSRALPEIGACAGGDRASYEYLAQSIRRFPNQSRLAAMLREAGFGHIKVTNLTFGVAALHCAWRL